MKTFSSIDKFGHPVEYNFNRKGQSHKSVCGAAVSIIAIIIMGVFVIKQMVVWLSHGADTNTTTNSINFDLGTDADIGYEQLNTFTSYQILHPFTFQPILYDDEFKKHLTLSFVQTEINFKTYPIVYKETKLGIEECDIDKLKAWNNTYNYGGPISYCMPQEANPVLQNKMFTQQLKQISFQIFRCNSTETECATDDQIDKFIENIYLVTKNFKQVVDLSITPPFKYVNDQRGRHFQSALVQYDLETLRKNEIITYDNIWMSLGTYTTKQYYYDINYYQSQQLLRAQQINPLLVYTNYWFLSQDETTYERQVFTLLDLLGSLGGIFEIIIGILGIFILPISQFSFDYKYISNMYHVRLPDIRRSSLQSQNKFDKMFDQSVEYPTKPSENDQDKQLLAYRIKHKNLPRLFCKTKCSRLARKCGNKNEDLQYKIYTRGKPLIEKDFQIERWMKAMLQLKFLIKEQDQDTQRRIKYDGKFRMIGLDDPIPSNPNYTLQSEGYHDTF